MFKLFSENFVNNKSTKITKHISFFFNENRICYINKIIFETNKYKFTTDLYIHTNSIILKKEHFNEYKNGSINIIYHDLSNINPMYLTWKCRNLLKKQANDYDIFIYIEDDILIPFDAILYWLEYNKKLIRHNYNLGFLRIETKDNEEYVVDLPGKKLYSTINLDNIYYCINNVNPYCAMWIYNKEEFNKFVNSKYYNINAILNYDIREKSAIGLHGISNYWYKGTLIPLINNKLNSNCKIYHLSNNYVTDIKNNFATINFDNAFQSS